MVSEVNGIVLMRQSRTDKAERLFLREEGLEVMSARSMSPELRFVGCVWLSRIRHVQFVRAQADISLPIDGIVQGLLEAAGQR